MNPRFLLVLTLLVAGLCASAGSAQAAGCTPTYSVATHVLTIHSCWADPDAPTIARISRTAAGAIQLDGQAIAGGPTVTNTDTIVYHGEDGNGDEITLDMSNGQFAPGFTPEVLGGKSEIEFDIDGGPTGPDNFLTILGMEGPAGDHFEVGATGIDVDDDDDSDITRTNLGRLTIDAQDGPDGLYGIGFAGYGTSAAPLTLRGGPGNDVIKGGNGSDDLSGGAGEDYVNASGAGGFTLTDTTLTGAGSDALAGFEHAVLEGSSLPETIDASGFNGPVAMSGAGGSDTLIGGSQDDRIRGYGGGATIHGGPGNDLLWRIVDNETVLTADSLSAPGGTDSFDSIEQSYLVGSDADDRIDASGFAGRAELRGGPGADSLIAAAGGGILRGGDEGDELIGGPGSDLFDGGPGDDRTFSRDELTEQVDCGDGADTAVADNLDGLVGCEQIDRGDTPAEPGQAGQPGQPGEPGGPGADAIAPALSKLVLSRRTFRAAPSGAALAAASVGTGVRFTLSESATVTFRIERAAAGRRVAGRCRAPSSRNRSRPACTRWVTLRGTLTHVGLAGPNKLVLRGRLGGRALAPGRYRLVALATDAAGNRSAPTRTGFRILAR